MHSLPDGYDTVINDEGDNISAGEKQLLTIARAFLADPSILILDDALSSVDAITEEKILTSMGSELKTRTSIVISHRISTAREADRVIVMDEGRIVEEGSHDDLVAAALRDASPIPSHAAHMGFLPWPQSHRPWWREQSAPGPVPRAGRSARTP